MKNLFKRKVRDLDPNGTAYLELLKSLLINAIYHPCPDVEEGKVWPEFPAMTMIGKPRLDNIQELALNCISSAVPGNFIEAGIWKGGAVALLAAIVKATGTQKERLVIGVDSFKGIPPAKPEQFPADAAHIGCDKLEVLSNNSIEEVEGYLQRLNLLDPASLKLIKGWFIDTLPSVAQEYGPFALVRIDGDTYESTSQCLEYLEPFLSKGGYVIIDDYYSWQGCRQATDDYRRDNNISAPLVTVDWTCVYWKK